MTYSGLLKADFPGAYNNTNSDVAETFELNFVLFPAHSDDNLEILSPPSVAASFVRCRMLTLSTGKSAEFT